MIVLGILAFALMLLGDINDARFGKKPLKLCFPLGVILLAVATYLGCDFERISVIWCVAAGAFLLLLLYSLFGSFSVKDAYVEQPGGRRVCDRGLYAMCRHPGVLFFAGLYICLCFAVRFPAAHTLTYITLDLLLAVLEDIAIFPKVLGGYDEYKTGVPFIITTTESLRNTFRR